MTDTKLSLLNTTINFLNRDVKSFFPGSHQQHTAEVAAGKATPVDSLVEPLTDSSNLEFLIFQREVMDWRDNIHAKIELTIIDLEEDFIRQIDIEITETSFFRKLITKSSYEVLQSRFVSIVRMPLMALLHQEEASLEACAKRGDLSSKDIRPFVMISLDAECIDLKKIGFKPANRDVILKSLHNLLHGQQGIAADFHQQVIQMATKLIKGKMSC
jgi:hypothetical protein